MAFLYFAFSVSSLFLEELLHEGSTFFFEDSAGDGAFRMEGVGGEALEPPLLVVGTIDEAAYLCPSDGSGAHSARLHGDVERALGQVFASELVGSHRDGLHLGMGGDVDEGLGQVVGSGNDAIAACDDGSDGDLANSPGEFGFGKCLSH